MRIFKSSLTLLLLTTFSIFAYSQAPTILTNPSNVSGKCGGNPVSFTSTASGNPTPTVQWYYSTNSGSTWVIPTTDFKGTTTGTLSFNAGQAVGMGEGNEYHAVFTNTDGNATSTAATLTFEWASVITTQPKDISVVAPATATFSVAGTYSPTSYQWELSTDSGSTWNNVSTGTGGTTASYTTPATTGAMNGYEYKAIVTNACGGATSASAALTVTGSMSYALAVSTSVNRSSAVALQGATLTGNEYIFTSPYGATGDAPTGVQYVSYYLDIVPPAKPTSVDYYTPFDFNNNVSTVTWIQGCFHSSTSSTTSACTLTSPSSTTAGTGLIVSVVSNNGGTVTIADTQSNTFTPIGGECAGTSYSIRSFYVNSIVGGADTITATVSPSEPLVRIYVQNYSGINGPPVIDQSVVCGTGSSASPSVGPVSTLYGKELIYLGMQCSQTCTGGTGFIARSTVDGNIIEDETVLTNGSYTGVAVQTPTGTYASQLATFPATSLVDFWNTTSASNATHTLTQVVMKTNGNTETDVATFTVNNPVAHSATLNWTAGSSTYPLASYSIGRSTTNGGGSGYSIVGTVTGSPPATTYIDNTVTGGDTYYYVVKEIDSQGNVSAWSNQATVVIP